MLSWDENTQCFGGLILVPPAKMTSFLKMSNYNPISQVLFSWYCKFSYCIALKFPEKCSTLEFKNNTFYTLIKRKMSPFLLQQALTYGYKNMQTQIPNK